MEKDRIIVQGLEAHCILGVYDWERKEKRPVRIDLEFPLTDSSGAGSDIPSVDYAMVAGDVKDQVEGSECHLIEELAEGIATLCLSRFALGWVRVRLSKPGAIPDAETVILEIERSASR